MKTFAEVQRSPGCRHRVGFRISHRLNHNPIGVLLPENVPRQLRSLGTRR